jgi:hypothetical protein
LKKDFKIPKNQNFILNRHKYVPYERVFAYDFSILLFLISPNLAKYVCNTYGRSPHEQHHNFRNMCINNLNYLLKNNFELINCGWNKHWAKKIKRDGKKKSKKKASI